MAAGSGRLEHHREVGKKMGIEVIREIAEILENAYTQFLDAYAVLDDAQERSISNPEIDKKFDQVNKRFGELRDCLNEAEHRVPDSGCPLHLSAQWDRS